MNCPDRQTLDLLAIGALDAPHAEALQTHVESCDACRGLVRAARRAHVDRLHRYEAFDRDHDRQREALFAALPPTVPARAGGWVRRMGETIMSLQPATRRTAAILLPAACIGIAAIVLFHGNQPSAFASALERIRQSQNIIARVQTYMGGSDAPMQTGKLWMSEELGMRFEAGDGGGAPGGFGAMGAMTMTHKPGGPVVLVQPAMKLVLRMHTPDGRLQGWSGGLDQSSPGEFLSALRKLTGEADKSLGRSTIDGRTVDGFEIDGRKLGIEPIGAKPGADRPPSRALIWVDVSTRLPARMEVEMVVQAGPMGPMQVRAAYDRFEFDAPLDASLFEPQIAEDARVVDIEVPAPSEQTLIDALKLYADVTGAYPDELDPARMTSQLVIAMSAKGLVKFDPADPSSLFAGDAVKHIMRVTMGFGFLQMQRQAGADFEYFGDDVTPQDADKVLLRWSTPGGATRVIYGDLRVE